MGPTEFGTFLKVTNTKGAGWSGSFAGELKLVFWRSLGARRPWVCTSPLDSEGHLKDVETLSTFVVTKVFKMKQ